MLETVVGVAHALGAGVDLVAVEGDADRRIRTAVITLEGTRIIAIEHPVFVQLVCVHVLAPEQRTLFGEAPEVRKREILASLREEMLFGRTRFQVAFEEIQGSPQFMELLMEQALFVADESWAKQRVADAIAELTIHAIRARVLLDGAAQLLADEMTPGNTRPSPEGMYR